MVALVWTDGETVTSQRCLVSNVNLKHIACAAFLIPDTNASPPSPIIPSHPEEAIQRKGLILDYLHSSQQIRSPLPNDLYKIPGGTVGSWCQHQTIPVRIKPRSTQL